ncbi:hypothetical protein [Nodularia sphaerocarpa]|uniref:hypothetical protein n=1 Tax=Nodularia sphaerocarpa TaxID=137816 RepID=UPI001EFA880F|nr:hypothetical protein [Nodularia sphaerocarpa]MDB9374218.1 hypothetical protein [Nodularia sphaerocarpa CS-585]MDB9377277.1 hypothetical protein [Nodularia sphaerocarpa CS-585A2]ULP74852.1 hypothetical protein BDGGKGIB_04523 [Nodularia sphaerocarpa UHCC 0038]
MKAILSGSILSFLICYPALSQSKSSDLPFCDFPEEEPSEINRTVTLTDVGIRITIPVNTRVVKKNDGSIELMDNGTYKLIQCMNKPNSGVAGRGYISAIIEKITPEYFYDYVIKEVPNKPQMYIASKTILPEDGVKTFEFWLRIKTPKGVFDIKNNVPTYPTSQEEITADLEGIEIRASLIDIIK